MPLNSEATNYYYVNYDGPVQFLTGKEDLEPSSYPKSINFQTLLWCVEQDHLGFLQVLGEAGDLHLYKYNVVWRKVILRLTQKNLKTISTPFPGHHLTLG